MQKDLIFKKLFVVALFFLATNIYVFGQAGKSGEFSTAGFYALPNSAREVYNFNPGWRFFKGNVLGAEKTDFDDSSWELANLPHGLEVEKENASGMRNYQGPAWYRKSFKAPQGATGQKLVIYFEAVMGKSTVWVNGKKAAEHFGGYLPFAVEVSGLLNEPGKSNIIAVYADNSNDPTYPPGKPQNDLDFTYLGGIYRDVYLIKTAPVHVSITELSSTIAGGGVFVAVKDVNGSDAQIEIRTELVNEGATTGKVTLRTTLEDFEGKQILKNEKTVNLATGTSQQIIQDLNPKNVHLWYPDDPYLHFIRTEVIQNGKVVDSYRTRFGIRLFEMRGKYGLFINKKYIGHKLNGVNRHQDYVYVGNALPNTGQWRDAKLLREGGSTIARAAHYPLDPAFMDACDEFGLLVTVATPGWQFFNKDNPIFEKRIQEDVRNMVRRDRNRPAVLLWETALNETDNQTIPMLKELHRITHEEFPYPGAFTVTDIDKAKKAEFDFFYHGGYNEDKCSFTREYGDGGEVDNFYSQNAMTRVKREWGEHAMLNNAIVRAKDLDGCFNTPPVRLGAALWCGIDHQRGYHPDPFWGGLLDVYRIPRYSYFLFKSQYDPDFKLKGIETGPMVYITHELTQESESDVIVYSNCQQIRLTWLGNVIGTIKPDSLLKHLPHAPFVFKNVFNFHVISKSWRERTNKIEMIAEGLIDGKVVCKQVKKYPERTTGIKLSVDSIGMSLVANGSDFVPVRASIVDNKGILKVLASEYVTFEIEGAGEIIGGQVNTINPMKTQFGTATILVRAGTKPGKIKIRAYTNGLKGDEIEFSSISAGLPLYYDEDYYKYSKSPDVGGKSVINNMKTQNTTEQDLEKLRDENNVLRLKLTSKEQDIMELKSKIVKP